MAVRSFFVGIRNNTSATMSRFSLRLRHGVWSADGVPEENVSAWGATWFQAESDGFATGVEGNVVYTLHHPTLPAETLYIVFNNPFVTGNEFRAETTGSSYQLGWGDPGGANARIDLGISLTASATIGSECDLGSLFSATRVSETVRDTAFARMREFRDDDFAQYPGLAPWWAAFQASIPSIADHVAGDEESRTAANELLGEIATYIDDPSQPVRHEHVVAARRVLMTAAEGDPATYQAFVEQGLALLEQVQGRTFEEALSIAASTEPRAETDRQ